MNSQFADLLLAAGTLDGDTLDDREGVKVRWNAITAHDQDVTVLVTSDTMTVGDGSTLLDATSITIPAGLTYFGYFKKLTFSTGGFTAYRSKGE